MNKKNLFIVFCLFLFAYFLRVSFLSSKALTFGYDQARDATNARQILAGDFKIQGPPSSAPGLFHGVFYYYFLAPAYLIGNGSPIVAAYWTAFFNSLAVFFVYILAFLITKKNKIGFLAAFLFAISFEATQYATWLSNPTLAMWSLPFFYLGLWGWTMEKESFWKKFGPIVAAVGFAISVQAEIFLLYHSVPLLVWLYLTRKKINRKQILVFATTVFVLLSSYLLSEIKFGFKGLGGVSSLLTTGDSIVASKGLGDFVNLFLNQLGRVYSFNSYPGNIGYGGAFVLFLVIATLVTILKDKKPIIDWKIFILLWLLSHSTVVTVGGTSTPFLLVGVGPAVSVILAIYLYKWFTEGKRLVTLLVLSILVFGNLLMIYKENRSGSTIFSIQKEMILSKQLQAIDYTYAASNGRDFSVNSITSPLWINIVWSYLYKWYGVNNYSYMPSWYGKSQVGQVDALPEVKEPTEIHFLIIEPLQGIPGLFVEEVFNEENSKSKLLEEKRFGQIIVQKRQSYKNENSR